MHGDRLVPSDKDILFCRTTGFLSVSILIPLIPVSTLGRPKSCIYYISNVCLEKTPNKTAQCGDWHTVSLQEMFAYKLFSSSASSLVNREEGELGPDFEGLWGLT